MSTRCSLVLLLSLLSLPLSCGSPSATPTSAGAAGAPGSAVGGSGGPSGGSSVVGGGGEQTGGAGDAADSAAAAGGGSSASEGSGDGGAAGGASSGGEGGATLAACTPWPAATQTVELAATLEVTGTLDGGLKRYVGAGELAGDGQEEGLPPLMQLADGAVLKNVVIGAPASDGIHCSGTCYLQNVWWEDVGEDAATLEGKAASQRMVVECAGARHASDKVFQHNGPGTIELRQIYVEDFGKLYRSCGNCKTQYERHVELFDVQASDGDALVGINETYGDTADFARITADEGITICSLYEANDMGDEPQVIGSGPDPDHCRYQEQDIRRP